jgi:cytochrome c556
MRIGRWVLVAGGLVIGSGCTGAAPSQPAPGLLRTATIKDIMDSMVDPSGDFMFESVAQIADEKGITEKAPETDDEWEQVRRHALILFEAPNLLTMEGRTVAAPGDRTKFPEVELGPDEIQKLIDGDRPSFIRRARRLQDAAGMALKAIAVKDKGALFHSIEDIDRACENCHLHYWYPNDKRALESAKASGILD